MIINFRFFVVINDRGHFDRDFLCGDAQSENQSLPLTLVCKELNSQGIPPTIIGGLNP